MPEISASLHTHTPTTRRELKSMSGNLYEITKGKAYTVLAVLASCDHPKAKSKGYRDGWQMLIDCHDDNEMALFCLNLPSALQEGHAKALLDGLAREYTGLKDWPEFVEAATEYSSWKPSKESLEAHKARTKVSHLRP
jgi:hypothetical protein